jgi:hypothetical protein
VHNCLEHVYWIVQIKKLNCLNLKMYKEAEKVRKEKILRIVKEPGLLLSVMENVTSSTHKHYHQETGTGRTVFLQKYVLALTRMGVLSNYRFDAWHPLRKCGYLSEINNRCGLTATLS